MSSNLFKYRGVRLGCVLCVCGGGGGGGGGLEFAPTLGFPTSLCVCLQKD